MNKKIILIGIIFILSIGMVKAEFNVSFIENNVLFYNDGGESNRIDGAQQFVLPNSTDQELHSITFKTGSNVGGCQNRIIIAEANTTDGKPYEDINSYVLGENTLITSTTNTIYNVWFNPSIVLENTKNYTVIWLSNASCGTGTYTYVQGEFTDDPNPCDANTYDEGIYLTRTNDDVWTYPVAHLCRDVYVSFNTTEYTSSPNQSMQINILYPTEGHLTNNNTVNILFNYTSSNTSAYCSLYNETGDAIITDQIILNNTNTNFNTSYLREENNTFFITCNDTINYTISDNLTFYVDTITPVIYDYIDGQTLSDGFIPSMNISDINTYAFNITFYKQDNTTILASYQYEGVTPTNGWYNINESITTPVNTTYLLNQTIYYRGNASDSHTIQTWLPRKIDYIADRLRIDEFISVMPENFDVDNMSYTILQDRINYTFTPSIGSPTVKTYEVECDTKLNHITNSEYKGHFTCLGEGLTGYWLDFENPENAEVNVTMINEKQAIVTTTATQFNSIGGLNYVNFEGEFTFTGVWVNTNISAKTKHTSTTITEFTVNSTEGRTDYTNNGTAWLILNSTKQEWITFNKSGWKNNTGNTSNSLGILFYAWDTEINITVYDWLRLSNINNWTLNGTYASDTTTNGSIIHKTITSLVGTENLTVSGTNFTTKTFILPTNDTYNYQTNVTSTIIKYFYLYIYNYAGTSLLSGPTTKALNTSVTGTNNPYTEDLRNYLDEENNTYTGFFNITDTTYTHINNIYNFTFNQTNNNHSVNLTANQLMLYFYSSNGSLATVEGTIIDTEQLNKSFNNTEVLIVQEDLADGRVIVLINHIGYTNWTQYYEYIKTTNQHITENIYIMDDVDFSIYFEVFDQNERVIEDAVVRIEYVYPNSGEGTLFDNRVLGQRLTGADGQTFFLVDSNAIGKVTVTKTGYAPWSTTLGLGDETYTSTAPYEVILSRSEYGVDEQRWELIPRTFKSRNTSINGSITCKGADIVTYQTSYRTTLGLSSATITSNCNYFGECDFSLAPNIDFASSTDDNITMQIFCDAVNWKNSTLVYKDPDNITEAFTINNISERWKNITLFILMILLSVGVNLLLKTPNAGVMTFLSLSIIMVFINPSTKFIMLALVSTTYFIAKTFLKRMLETP